MPEQAKKLVKTLLLKLHPVAQVLNRVSPQTTEPFLRVITPVFDGAIDSVKLLVTDLQKQSFTDFSVVLISNGPVPLIRKYIHQVNRDDVRFLLKELPKEATETQTELLANVGKRRAFALKTYSGKRFAFIDADLKILDKNYFAKIWVAHFLTRKDIICTQIQNPDKNTPILPLFPIGLGRIDMANFTFSKRIAKTFPYPTNYDPQFGMANDYRYFIKIHSSENTIFLDTVSALRNGNNRYSSLSNFSNGETPQLISVFGNSFNEYDTQAVSSVLQSHIVGRGKVTDEFERQFKEKIGFKYGTAVHSCTNAFWLLFKTLRLKSDEEVIIPNIHFYGVHNVLNLLRIKYKIADVDSVIPNINLESIKPLLTPKTKAIIFLEYGGQPVNLAPIKKYLKSIQRQDILLILDAANSPFTIRNKRHTALDYDFALYSFDMNKILVTGDGGMVLSQNKGIIDEIRTLATWGISDKVKTGYERSLHSETWWSVTIPQPGLNMEMNNIAAAIGLSQLPKISSILKQRKQVDTYYRKKLNNLVKRKIITITPAGSKETENNLYFFWIRVNSEKKRNELAKHLLRKGIFSTMRYQPLSDKVKTPNAFSFYNTALCIPMHQNLNPDHLEHIVTQIQEFFKHE